MNKIKFKLVAKGNVKEKRWDTKVSHSEDLLEVCTHVANWFVRTLILCAGWNKEQFVQRMDSLYDAVKEGMEELEDFDNE